MYAFFLSPGKVKFIPRMLYFFVRTATTNYYKLGGLKQRKCLPSRFQRAEIQNQLHGVAVKVSAGTVLPPGALEQNLFPAGLFQHPVAVSSPWFQPPGCNLCLCSIASPLPSVLSSSVCGKIPLSPFYEDTWDGI